MHQRSMAAKVAVLAFVIVATAAAISPASHAAGEFPYDKEMILDARPIGAAKRLPILTVEPNGNAVIDLWCKSVPGRVQVAANSVRIEAAPLPEQLPAMMVRGQCSPERMQADQDLLAALAQATEWRWQGSTFVLNGPVTLRFHASSH